MENKKRKSTGLLLSILGVISLVLITAGVTYAFFSYAKQGEKENTITTGSITFIYNETSERLNISDALPKADSVGTAENANNAFTFTVTSTTPSTAYINYIVTARMDSTSTLPTDQVKLYLTSTLNSGSEGTVDVPATGLLATGEKTGTASAVLAYSELADANATNYPAIFANNVAPTAGTTEKVIYVGQVPANRKSTANPDATYTRTFKLNMWLKGAEEVAAHCSDSSITTQEACVSPAEWIPASQNTNGMADYSAYEFVKKTTPVSTSELSIPTLEATRTGSDKTQYGILTSVEYYTLLESQADQTAKDAFAAQYTRIAYVNYSAKKIITVEQSTGETPAVTAPDTTSENAVWEANEQYYPFNGGTFKVTINVYAEGATTYTVPAPANSGN